MSRPALEFLDVTVRFKVPLRPVSTLKEWAIRRLTSGLGFEERVALSEVSLSVGHGETFGVIGANGAGKSTLLRVAAGIVPPTAGAAVIRGRVAPLIELGTGFDMELTGRENVFFNGALLGRSQAEMARRVEEIVGFSGLRKAIDAPLRTYSTGMVVRLAFAVATAVDADVLLLDEILSVGDEAFRRRCRRRIDTFREQGASIMLVSHDLEAIERFCARAALLEEGRVTALGPTAEVIAAYRASIRRVARPAGTSAAIAAGMARDPGWRTTRAGVAVALVDALHGGEFVPTPASGVFSDLPAGHADAPYVEELARLGLVAGFPDGSFHAEEPVTRAQLAVLLVKARHGARPALPPAEGFLADVPAGYWAAQFVEQLVREGIACAYGDGSFQPDQAVSERDLELLLERALG
jgi:ABC-2 type transport system ATP-binding protein/lipopolysaccharide transport system ATP-binding protein